VSKPKAIGRRDFFKGAAAGAAAASLAAGQQTDLSDQMLNDTKAPEWVNVGAPNRLERYTKIGQPIDLHGRKMVFTSYEYMLPAASPAWYDDQEKNVSVIGTGDLWNAHLKPSEDVPTGIRLTAQPAQNSKAPYEIERTKPWERDGVSLSDVMFDQEMEMHWAGNILFDEDDGYFKAWGHCSSNGTTYRCYLQSKDLQNWERPNLGLIDFNGNRNNNLIQVKDKELFGYVFKDPSSREERWKWLLEGFATFEQLERYRKKRALAYDPKALRLNLQGKRVTGYKLLAVTGGVSPDGFRWTTLPDPVVIEHSDMLHCSYYDVESKRYVAYFRTYAMPAYSHHTQIDDHGQNWKSARRSIGRSETDNFREFPLSEMIVDPAPDFFGPSDTFYTNTHTFVPGTKDQHLFFSTVWHQDMDTTSVYVAASRDGRIVHWLPGNPVFGTSAFGEWDGGCLFSLPDLLETPSGDWVLPYIGFNVPHKYPRRGAFKYGFGWATWPKGRFTAIEAKQRGQFTTYAFIPPGRKIRLNALTDRAGKGILVEVVDMSKKVLPGRSFEDCNPILGDQQNALVTWKGEADLNAPNGAPIALRFRMDNAKLFSVDFAD